MGVVKFRPFKFERVATSAFLQSREQEHTAFMLEDLAKSGLEQQDLSAYVHGFLQLPEGALAGYVIPYYLPDGERYAINDQNSLKMYRIRLQWPSHLSDKPKYIQPSSEELAQNKLPPNAPYIPPCDHPDDVIAICEGEKKTISVIKHLGIRAIGIGGCWNWKLGDELHPWIKQVVAGKKVLLIPDADIWRYDITRAYGDFAHALESVAGSVEIAEVPDKIDDWIVAGGTREQFDDLRRIKKEELVQSKGALAKKYNLAFKVTKDGGVDVYQHTANVMRLMEAHPAFPRVWHNRDTNRVMIGEASAVPDMTEMEVANYFQFNLGFEKVGHKTIRDCVRALSKKNAKSPFLEWVRGQMWDGDERLETWMIRLWGAPDTDFVREVSKKWLISSIARMEHPGTKVDWMPIVIGSQGTGKTTMPSILFKGNSLTLYGDSSDKDLHMKIHSALVIGFDELDSFGKKETSFLKAMITTSHDHFRPPYGSSVELHERRSVLYGCGNRKEFLMADPSGYRRYACIEVYELLNFAGLEAELSQLWAEAYHHWSLGGVDYWEVEGADEMAQDFVAPNMYEEKILQFLDMRARQKFTDGQEYFTTADVMEFMGMGKNVQNSHLTRDLAAMLGSMGFSQAKKWVPSVGQTRRVWVKE
jgi:hypothetical protein